MPSRNEIPETPFAHQCNGKTGEAMIISPEVVRLSYLLAMAVIANLAELMIPRIPLFPWLKIGLANAFTIAVLILYSSRDAVVFALLRTVMAGLLSGSPVTSFLFSGTGGILSALGMAFTWKCLGEKRWIGLAGTGMVGAVLHNLAQLGVAYFIFVRNVHFLWQIPFLLLFSLGSGAAVGFLAKPVIQAFGSVSFQPEPLIQNLYRLSRLDKLKPLGFLALIIVILITRDPLHFLLIFLAIMMLSRTLHVPLGSLLSAAGKFWGLFVWNILLNLFFTPGRFWFWGITYEGLGSACLLSGRLCLCIWTSVIFLRAGALQVPLQLFSKWPGGKNYGAVFSHALALLPTLAAIAKKRKWRTLSDFRAFVHEVLEKEPSFNSTA